MKKIMRKLAVCLLVALPLSGTVTAATPPLGHVVIVMFENHSYSAVVGSSAMPYLNSLIHQYSLATGFYATAPGSVPDYFMVTTGQTIACCPSFTGPVTANNLVRDLNAAGKSWKVYAQGLPFAGYLGSSSSLYPYVKYHNPFAYFSDVVNSSAQAKKIVPLSQLSTDTASGTLPSFALIIPDNRHNAHDCPVAGVTNCMDADKLRAADQFLQNHIPALMTTPAFQQNGLLVIWWDEGSHGDTANGGGHVAITLVGPQVKRGFRSAAFFKNQNLLRTIVDGLRLPTSPGASSGAIDMGTFFIGH